ncbi:Uncharacterized protein Nst1_146 [Candidatus Nanobsidianus stetteri]|uniref:Uncharacterized protein n=1 Tax=Nanobsidianus stetteri TaxID=1294122 RepID=R1E5Y7_NANST|nr:Uncharacterized protein Nst1_146 [Candidatus Nanobsidianus stetteri]
MYNRQSYKSYEKTYDLLEKNKKLELEYPIREIRGLFYLISKHIQENANLPKIERLTAVIDLYCNMHNEPTSCIYDTKMDIYNDKYKLIGCSSKKQDESYEIKCTNYNDISFIDLSNSPQITYSLEGIKYLILSAYNTLYPGILIDMSERGNQYIDIITKVSMNLNNSTNENPKMFVDNNLFIFNSDGFIIEIFWEFYHSPKLYLF